MKRTHILIDLTLFEEEEEEPAAKRLRIIVNPPSPLDLVLALPLDTQCDLFEHVLDDQETLAALFMGSRALHAVMTQTIERAFFKRVSDARQRIRDWSGILRRR